MEAIEAVAINKASLTEYINGTIGPSKSCGKNVELDIGCVIDDYSIDVEEITE